MSDTYQAIDDALRELAFIDNKLLPISKKLDMPTIYGRWFIKYRDAIVINTNAPTDQHEGYITSFFEDDNKEVLCFEQYKPEHIVVSLDYIKGEYVHVMRVNEDGTINSKIYKSLPTDKE